MALRDPNCLAFYPMPRKRSQDIPPSRRRNHFIKEWRKYRGLTQEQLGDKLGERGSSISQLENGKQGYTQWKLEALALALGTQPGSLLCRNPLRNPAPPPPELVSMWDELTDEIRPQALEIIRVLRKPLP